MLPSPSAIITKEPHHTSLIFRIPEVLSYILAFCDNPSLAVCARISHAWHVSSIRHLWRTIDDYLNVWSLLGPLTEVPTLVYLMQIMVN